MPPSPITQNQCRPATKNSPHQTMLIRMVWPKSGCITSGVIVSGSNRKAISVPGRSGRRVPSANAQAARTTKAGFRNSDGCTEPIGPSVSQRRAPFTSMPR